MHFVCYLLLFKCQPTSAGRDLTIFNNHIWQQYIYVDVYCVIQEETTHTKTCINKKCVNEWICGIQVYIGHVIIFSFCLACGPAERTIFMFFYPAFGPPERESLNLHRKWRNYLFGSLALCILGTHRADVSSTSDNNLRRLAPRRLVY